MTIRERHKNAVDMIEAGAILSVKIKTWVDDVGELLDLVDAKDTLLAEAREIVDLLRVVIISGVSMDKEELNRVHIWLKAVSDDR